MTRLVRDGFGIGALPASLVSWEIDMGKLSLLQGVSNPPPMDIIATWRTGVGLELIEDIVLLANQVLAEHAVQWGRDRVVLLQPASGP